jgi:hypothetical protein
VRDLVRAGEAAPDDLRRKHQQLLSFLLRHSRIYSGGGHWTLAHRRRLAAQKFEHAAQQIVFPEGVDAIEDALQRLRGLEKQLALIVPEWSMAPVVEAYQAMRGASFLVAVIFSAEIGDVRRFDTPRQLMSFLGLVPAESSTGDTIRRKGLTLAGNRRARRAPVEAAWTYRFPARVSDALRAPGWRGCQSPCATSPGRPRSVCAPVTVGSAQLARSFRSSWLRLLARWLRSYGLSDGGSRRRKQDGLSRRCPEPEAEHERWGTPSLVMWLGPRPTPVL